MASDYQRIASERRRLEIADRKARDEEHRDPELEQAFTAWAAYRTGGGQDRFETWRQQWIKDKEATDGQNP